ncbi:unnamed protein product, partial [Polarella glacialis]
MVWACASRDQMPEAAFGFEGRATVVQGLGGEELVVAELSKDHSAGMLVLAGLEAESQSSSSSQLCSLGSLRLEASRQGYVWRAKDPSPLAERAAELGGSEYLRLLECPVALGFLDPALRVAVADQSKPAMHLSVLEHASV